jgi:hypothetical protein
MWKRIAQVSLFAFVIAAVPVVAAHAMTRPVRDTPWRPPQDVALSTSFASDTENFICVAPDDTCDTSTVETERAVEYTATHAFDWPYGGDAE